MWTNFLILLMWTLRCIHYNYKEINIHSVSLFGMLRELLSFFISVLMLHLLPRKVTNIND